MRRSRLFINTLMALAGSMLLAPIANAQTFRTDLDNDRFTDRFSDRPGYGNGWGWRRGQNINAMQARISAKLERGLDDGSLTYNEYRFLKNRLNRINFMEQEMRESQGHLTFYERQRLMAALSNLNQQVNDQLHDTEIAGRRSHWF